MNWDYVPFIGFIITARRVERARKKGDIDKAWQEHGAFTKAFASTVILIVVVMVVAVLVRG